MKIALVSCTKLKASYPCTAREMYQESTLFKKAVNFIEQQGYDDWYVLSAKYGLLRQKDLIEPSDLTLNTMKVSERRKWSEMVIKQLEDLQLDITNVDFYAGAKYREYLIPTLTKKGLTCNVPLEGKAIGEQLSYYTTHTR
ncbi:hypothetical protein M3221_18325 [Domibacillus indicus]|uniref:DUF6884 domain-containing protein n=1 Tax=Domibacillus indicus TaxID=1437523 RepID=UPI00203D4E38|nr:DUF6884 domain-containing protein [Domibacillus indicus]MCM3790337.1 hypothetical protein [Domibacillus indicus]